MNRYNLHTSFWLFFKKLLETKEIWGQFSYYFIVFSNFIYASNMIIKYYVIYEWFFLTVFSFLSCFCINVINITQFCTIFHFINSFDIWIKNIKKIFYFKLKISNRISSIILTSYITNCIYRIWLPIWHQYYLFLNSFIKFKLTIIFKPKTMTIVLKKILVLGMLNYSYNQILLLTKSLYSC